MVDTTTGGTDAASMMPRSLPLWLTRVLSNSMAPGLRDGQLVLTLRPRRRHCFRRGAVVAVDSREVGRRIVKRIIGLPGERVRMEGGRVWLDGQRLAEPYASASASAYQGTFDVPEGHYLLLGDNRDASSDSRTWRNPYVGRGEIAGVLLHKNRKIGSGSFPALRRASCRWRQSLPQRINEPDPFFEFSSLTRIKAAVARRVRLRLPPAQHRHDANALSPPACPARDLVRSQR